MGERPTTHHNHITNVHRHCSPRVHFQCANGQCERLQQGRSRTRGDRPQNYSVTTDRGPCEVDRAHAHTAHPSWTACICAISDRIWSFSSSMYPAFRRRSEVELSSALYEDCKRCTCGNEITGQERERRRHAGTRSVGWQRPTSQRGWRHESSERHEASRVRSEERKTE